MAEGRRRRDNLVPLASLISRELKNEKMEKPTVRYGHAAQSKKGEDYFLVKMDRQRVPGNSSSTFSVFAVIIILPLAHIASSTPSEIASLCITELWMWCSRSLVGYADFSTFLLHISI